MKKKIQTLTIIPTKTPSSNTSSEIRDYSLTISGLLLQTLRSLSSMFARS